MQALLNTTDTYTYTYNVFRNGKWQQSFPHATNNMQAIGYILIMSNKKDFQDAADEGWKLQITNDVTGEVTYLPSETVYQP